MEMVCLGLEGLTEDMFAQNFPGIHTKSSPRKHIRAWYTR